jgi:hypothetical protein
MNPALGASTDGRPESTIRAARVEPSELIDTNWYDNPREPDGDDDYPGSILDFAFVAGPAKDWKSVCNVIVREDDFPDDEKTSDHRPYELIISK